MNSSKRIWALCKSAKKRTCPSLVSLCLWSITSPFLPGGRTKADEQKAKLSKLLQRISDGKGLKEKVFSELLRRGCYEGSILSSFSSSKGGFLSSLDLSTSQISNRGLGLVGSIKTLSVLILQSCTNFDDGGLSILAHGACAGELRVLDLSKCRKLTDSGLSHLPSFTRLRTLDLSGLLITDDGANELRGLVQLQQLSLSRTKITGATIESFVADFVPGGRETGLVSLKALKLNFVELAYESIPLLARFPSLAVVELFGRWPPEDILGDFQHQLDQHRGNVVAHRMTGKLLMAPPKAEKREVDRENSWRVECPHSQWNTRQLALLLNGSPPAAQRTPWETTRQPIAPQTPSSPFASGAPAIPPINFRLCVPQRLTLSNSLVELGHEKTLSVSVESQTTTNRLLLLPAASNLKPQQRSSPKTRGNHQKPGRGADAPVLLERSPPFTRKRRRANSEGTDNFLRPFFSENTKERSAASKATTLGGEISTRDREERECAQFRSKSESDRVQRAQSYRALRLYCEHAERQRGKRRRKAEKCNGAQ